jgi:hypothetical protein
LKHRELQSFIRDLHRLSQAERETFMQVVREAFHPACERYVADPSAPWPRGLRVKRLQGHPGVWEMTWSFAGPDGRATFEWIEMDGEAAVLWRRIGGHEIFDRP